MYKAEKLKNIINEMNYKILKKNGYLRLIIKLLHTNSITSIDELDIKDFFENCIITKIVDDEKEIIINDIPSDQVIFISYKNQHTLEEFHEKEKFYINKYTILEGNILSACYDGEDRDILIFLSSNKDKSCIFFNNNEDYYKFLKSLDIESLKLQYINNENFVSCIENNIFRFLDYIKGIFYSIFENTNDGKKELINSVYFYFNETIKKYFLNLPYSLCDNFAVYMDIKENCDDVIFEFQKNESKIRTSYNALKRMVREIDQLLNEICIEEIPDWLKINELVVNVQKSTSNIQNINDICFKIIEIIENNLALFPLLLKEMVNINEFEVLKKYKLLGPLEKSIVTRSLIDYDYYDFSHFFNNSVITNISINNEYFKVNSKKEMKKIIIITNNLENKNIKNMEEIVSKYQLDINDINNIYIVHLGEEKYNEFIEIIFSEDC